MPNLFEWRDMPLGIPLFTWLLVALIGIGLVVFFIRRLIISAKRSQDEQRKEQGKASPKESRAAQAAPVPAPSTPKVGKLKRLRRLLPKSIGKALKWLLLCILALAVATFFLLRGPFRPWLEQQATENLQPRPAMTFTVTVKADQPGWTVYNFVVTKGSIIRFKASGVANCDPKVGFRGPAGAEWLGKQLPSGHQFLDPGGRVFALLGRIADETFVIGDEAEIECRESGLLKLAINERRSPDSWIDNVDGFSVDIIVYSSEPPGRESEPIKVEVKPTMIQPK